MTTTRLYWTLTALLVAAAPCAAAQSRSSAEVRLQAAIHTELVVGDLERALQLYRELAADRGAGRTVTATALVNLGRTYEKLGNAQARAAYERVVRDYGDQAEPVRLARERLQTLATVRLASAGAGDPRDPTYTMVLGDLPPLRARDAPQFDLSPDGGRIVMRTQVSVGDSLRTALVIAEQSGTVVRRLVQRVEAGNLVSPRWSPDGRLVLYVERGLLIRDTATHRFMVVAPGGSAPRHIATLVGMAPVTARGGLFWTPDSRAFTFATQHSLETMDLEGRTIRSVPFRVPYLMQITGYSPDGRWLAFHAVNEGTEQPQETDVWIMPAEGGRAIQITHAGGFDGWPTWSPDGRSIYFVSERGGSSNVWKQEMDLQAGLPRGEARQVTSYSDVSVLHPRFVDNGRRLSFALVRHASVIYAGPASSAAQNQAVARGGYSQLAPDGAELYYAGEGPGQEGIWAIAVDGGTPRRLSRAPLPPPPFPSFFLSPDGGALAWFSQVGTQNHLYVVPATGGEPRELIRFESREHLVPSWSPDGRELAFSRGNGLYAISAAGGEPRRIAELYSWDGWTVRWSPDGRHIAALAWSAPGTPTQQNAVFVVPAAGGEPRRLTPPEEYEYKEGLEWHPDGQRLTYMYYQHANGDGTRIAWLDDRPTALLVDQPSPHWDYVGNWSPDGQHYYFISAARSNAWALFRYDDRAGSTRAVVDGGGANPGVRLPSFSRDGRIMAYSIARDSRQLWVMELR